jgi:8-oxo-dGTP pyrophosphatase MutT (NUDIX family)
MAEQLYNLAQQELNSFSAYNLKYYTYLNTIENIIEHGFSGDFSLTKTQIREQININNNLIQQRKKIIDEYENEIREFSINLLVHPEKKIWLNRRNNVLKDFFNFYQGVCGRKEKNETNNECAIRETIEEANIKINIDELNYIDIHTGFRTFPDGKECIFRTVLYFTITNQEPQNMEPEKHDDWFCCDLKDLKKYQLTDSLKLKLDKIVEIVSKKCTSLKRKRKRVENDIEEEIQSLVSSPSEKDEHYEHYTEIQPIQNENLYKETIKKLKPLP